MLSTAHPPAKTVLTMNASYYNGATDWSPPPSKPKPKPKPKTTAGGKKKK